MIKNEIKKKSQQMFLLRFMSILIINIVQPSPYCFLIGQKRLRQAFVGLYLVSYIYWGLIDRADVPTRLFGRCDVHLVLDFTGITLVSE